MSAIQRERTEGCEAPPRGRELLGAYQALAGRFEAILRCSPVTLAELDQDLRVLWAYNLPPDLAAAELVGQHPRAFLPPDQGAPIVALLEEVLDISEARRRDVWLDLADGRHCYDVWVEPLALPEPGVRVVAVEVTGRKRAEAQQEALIKRLRRMVRHAELFMGVLVHDLRNPLTSIIAVVHTLKLQAPASPRNAKLDRILASSARMTRMIDQLLDFSRIRVGGGLDLHPAPADLGELADTAALEAAPAPHRRITVHRTGDASGQWDADRLLQAFANLVRNAVENAEEPEVEIDVDGRHPHEVRMSVTNAGEVPEALRPVLFEPFHGGSEEPVQRKGLGLGLYIAREIARAHGGEIVLDGSRPGRTRFEVTLPRRAPARLPTREAFGF